MTEEDEAFDELSLKQGQWEHTSGWRKKQILEASMTRDEIIEIVREVYGTAATEQEIRLAKLVAEKEPVAWESVYETIIHWDECGGKRSRRELARRIVSLYTAPPQRKPLTNGEIYTAYITATNQTLRATDERLAFAFARAIEAAHGIKE